MSNVKKSLFSGLLLVSESLANKLIGLASTLVLARVLLPEDFGLVAISMIVLSLVQALSNTGSIQYLLKVDNLTTEIVNTSWSLNLVIKTALSILMLISTELVVSYYGDERLRPVLYVFSSMVFIQTLRNPGLAFLRYKQNYAPIVKLSVVAKLFSVSTAITVAIVDKSHWALVLGHFVNTCVTVIGTYIIHSHRPSFCFSQVRAQFDFAKWLVPQSILGFFRTQFDSILVSATYTKDLLGSYNVLKYIAFIPTSHIVQPATEPLLRQLSSVRDKPAAFVQQYNASFLATLIVASPITALMLLYPNLIVSVLLGEKWVEYSELFSHFAILILAASFLNHARRCLIVYGNTKAVFYYEIFSFILIYSFIITLKTSEIMEFTALRVSLELLTSFILFVSITIRHTTKSNIIEIFKSLIPLIFSVLFAVSLASFFQPEFSFDVLELTIKCCMFLTFYSLCLLLVIFYSNNSSWVYLRNKYKSLFS